MRQYDAELALVEKIVREAGARVLHLSEQGYEIKTKPDHSQVTTADLEVDQMLKEGLLNAYPDDGWLSEETPDDHQRLGKTRIWILDPIDGTRSFIDNIPEYVISIGLVEDSKPVLAMIFNPVTDEMFSAIKGRGSYLNGKAVHVNTTPSGRLTVLANLSPTHRKNVQSIQLTADYQPFGSIAYALAMVAAGKADVTLNPGYQNEWDIAAGVLLVQEAGGTVVDSNWQVIQFNQRDTSIPGVIATRSDKAATVQNLLGTIAT